MIWESEKLDIAFKQIVIDYFLCHKKFPKEVTCRGKTFELDENDTALHCVGYNEVLPDNENPKLGIRFFFSWYKIAKITAKIKPKK